MMEKAKLVRKINLVYALIQGIYWSGYCAVSTYAAVYLKSLGYSNSELGVIIASGSFLAFFLPFFLSPVIDASEKLTSSKVVVILELTVSVLGLSVFFMNEKSTALTLCYILWLGFMYMCNPLCTQIALDRTEAGFPVNFGTARAFGSFAFVLMSAGIGKALAGFSCRVLPASAVFLQLCLTAVILLLGKLSGTEKKDRKKPEEQEEKSLGILEFIRENPVFFMLLFGIALIFTGSGFLSTYMINIVENLGGTATDMGYIHAFLAFMEVPAMILWTRIRCGKNSVRFLIFSLLCFTLKMCLFCFAGSLPVLYLAGILQFFGYGIYTPAIVDYVRNSIPFKDSVKAQSISGAMITLGSMTASTLGGVLTDAYGVETALLAATGLSALGTVIGITAVLIRSGKKSADA